MSSTKKCLTTIFGGVSLAIALSTTPLMAAEGEKATVKSGDVIVEAEVTGSDASGFSIRADNPGTSDQKCDISLTLTKKEGTQTWKYDKFLVSPRSVKQSVDGQAGISGAPLSHPKLEASCH
jgi:hypothetical protein